MDIYLYVICGLGSNVFSPLFQLFFDKFRMGCITAWFLRMSDWKTGRMVSLWPFYGPISGFRVTHKVAYSSVQDSTTKQPIQNKTTRREIGGKIQISSKCQMIKMKIQRSHQQRYHQIYISGRILTIFVSRWGFSRTPSSLEMSEERLESPFDSQIII